MSSQEAKCLCALYLEAQLLVLRLGKSLKQCFKFAISASYSALIQFA